MSGIVERVIAATYTSAELITVIGVIFTGLTGLAAAVFAGIAAIRAAQAHKEVKTMNGIKMGELADAGETRRVEAIPVADRTAAEAEHVAAVPPPPDTPS